jgi:hypothetical protein
MSDFMRLPVKAYEVDWLSVGLLYENWQGTEVWIRCEASVVSVI